MSSLKEKQIDRMLDKIIGNGDDALRIVTKLAMTNTEITPEVLATIEYLKKQNEEEAKALEEELSMTLDASGNLVPVIGNSSYSATPTPYEPILTQERAGEIDRRDTPLNVVCPITYTVVENVIHDLNGVIDIGGNLPHRLPIGKT